MGSGTERGKRRGRLVVPLSVYSLQYLLIFTTTFYSSALPSTLPALTALLPLLCLATSPTKSKLMRYSHSLHTSHSLTIYAWRVTRGVRGVEEQGQAASSFARFIHVELIPS